MACGVEYVAILLDFAPCHGFKTAHHAAANAHQIRDVTKSVLDRLITCVHMTVKFLSIACAGEKVSGVRTIETFPIQTGADKQKFGIASEILELACDSCHASSTV